MAAASRIAPGKSPKRLRPDGSIGTQSWLQTQPRFARERPSDHAGAKQRPSRQRRPRLISARNLTAWEKYNGNRPDAPTGHAFPVNLILTLSDYDANSDVCGVLAAVMRPGARDNRRH